VPFWQNCCGQTLEDTLIKIVFSEMVTKHIYCTWNAYWEKYANEVLKKYTV